MKAPPNAEPFQWRCPNGHPSQAYHARRLVPRRLARSLAPRCPRCKAVMVAE